ncbi:MAG: formyltransferase family protein [Thermodesulfovibrio sp.]|nr:formyltransferase family protein [Thermodesulfovibrio sp.]
MKIAFIGTTKFSELALKKLIELGENVVAVFTKEKSDFHSDYAPLKPVCEENEIPCYMVKNINDVENVEILKKIKPDVIYCFGFSQIIQEDILSIPPKGVIGFHPTNLPHNRGRHPIIWSLFLGLKETASTFFIMDRGIDSGDIISQERIPIYYEDDAGTLYDRICQVAMKQIQVFTQELKIGSIRRIKQSEMFTNYWRKRSKIDGLIDFRMSSYAIYNLVRALTRPYVGAHVIYKGREVKVWKVREEGVYLPNIEPGKVLEVDKNTILVKTYDNAIRIILHEFDELPKVGDYIL